MDFELLAALGPHFQNAFGAAHFAFLFYDAVVLGPEALTKFLAAVPSRQNETHDGNHDNCRNYPD